MSHDTRAPRHEQAVRALLRGIEVPPEGPEERRLRQMDILEAVRRIHARDYGCVPVWIATLRREVEEGRL